MFLRCVCLRSVTSDDSHKQSDSGNSALHKGASSVNAFQPPARSVSPADVRRTGSGCAFRHRGAVQLDLQTPPKVLGGQAAIGATHTGNPATKENQHCHIRPTADRILQPMAASQHDEARQQSKLVQRFKRQRRAQLSHGKDTKQSNAAVSFTASPCAPSLPTAPCKSILEASARRMARHKTATVAATSEPEQMQHFLTTYMSAVSEGNQQWANSSEIEAMFAADAVLKTQDKQTFYGRPAVLKRLNNGVGMLTKLLGNGTKSSAIPRPEVQGPDQIDDSTWAMTYSFRTGVMKYSIKAQFSFENGKIVMLHNSRV